MIGIPFSGYNHRKICDLDNRGRHEHGSCLKYLFHDYDKQPTGTVGSVFQALRNIGREDAARVLFIDSTEGRTQASQNQAKHIVQL